jgi:HAD superfamily hydrolase (TIGR01549 family)
LEGRQRPFPDVTHDLTGSDLRGGVTPALALHPPRNVKLQAILLDIDGTLIDSNDQHTDCWVEAFARFDQSVEWDVIRGQIGKGGDLLVPDVLQAREMRSFGEELKKYRGELWKEKYMRTVQPFRGAVDAIRALHELGIKLALASSSNPEEVEYYVELLGVGDLLEGTTSKEDAEFSKPSPEIFRAALERVKSDPARTLAVGDTPYDILAAHRTPVPIAAVLCGGFPRESLAKAELLFDDVPAMVKELSCKELNRIDEYFRE